ncbi:MAG: hypothetical protein IKR73_05810, partial [Oscillospiraceae bacterium]|nr:hypothetical protein [Oscillospiraceae bacterium]
MRYKSPLSLLLSAALLVSGAVCTDVRGIGAEDHAAPADMSAEEIISRTEEIDAKIASSCDENGFCAAELTDDEFDTLQLAIDLAAEQSGYDEEDLGTDSAVYMSASNCIHGWYYDQLTDIQKQMYDAVGDSCESYLAGDLSTVSSRGYFDIVTMDVKMSGDEIRQVFYAFFYSNPQYFFLPSQVGYSNGKNPSQLALTSNTPCRDAVNRHDQRDRIEQLSTEWMTAINAGTTVGAKTKILADTISAHVVYETMTDENVKDSYGRPLAYQSILTPMLYGKAICTGYAMTVNFMARKMGLDCIVVTSNRSAAEAHAWNRIKIGETWYEFDTTWYDKESGKYDDRWLLRSSASFSELDPRGQHAIYTDFILYTDVTLPVCTEA